MELRNGSFPKKIQTKSQNRVSIIIVILYLSANEWAYYHFEVLTDNLETLNSLPILILDRAPLLSVESPEKA